MARYFDPETLNFLLFILSETFLTSIRANPQFETIQSLIIGAIRGDEAQLTVARDVLSGSKGPKWRPSGLSVDHKISSKLSNEVLSIMEIYLNTSPIKCLSFFNKLLTI